MWEQILTTARWLRRQLYEVSSASFLGIDIDIVLHFVVGAVIFAMAARRWGNRAACWTLAICIVAKEVIDLFAKSSTEYLQIPTAAGWRDTVEDIFFSMLGGFVAWMWQRWRSSRF